MIEDPVAGNDWYVVARSGDVNGEDPLAVTLLDEDLVLWRSDGEVRVWKDLCLHRGAKLSLGEVRDGRLECPYHGWTYNGEGRCVEIPAHPDQPPPKRFQVIQYHAEEAYGWVWVCLGEPEREIPPFPEWEDDSYRKIFCGPYEFDAAAPRAVENFLDVAHLPFVHEGILGDRDHPKIPDFEVEMNEDGIRADDVEVWQPDPDGSGEGDWVHYSYRTYRAFTAMFSKEREGKRFKNFITVTPVTESRSKMWVYEALNFNHDIPAEDMRARQDRITGQDIPIVESQRPEKLPLDLQAELHRPADRCSIAYRKWLNRQGLTFGTA